MLLLKLDGVNENHHHYHHYRRILFRFGSGWR
jgi:hypothetical protein